MEQKTQPVLCCLCSKEYPDPTQFVMERLFSSASLDWKVITAQIEADAISDAIAGIKALNLSAIRFGYPFDAPGMHSFLSDSRDVSFLGAISSAGVEENTWSGWHSFGHALVELVCAKIDWSSTAVLLNNDSVEQRSSMVAMAGRPPASVIWSDFLEVRDSLAKWVDEGDEPSTGDAVSFVDIGQLEDSLIAARETCEHLVVVAPSQATLAALEAAEPEEWKDIICWDAQGQIPPEISRLSSFRSISETDLSVAIDEYDFSRWTGDTPNHNLLVDAHEEYSSF